MPHKIAVQRSFVALYRLAHSYFFEHRIRMFLSLDNFFYNYLPENKSLLPVSKLKLKMEMYFFNF